MGSTSIVEMGRSTVCGVETASRFASKRNAPSDQLCALIKALRAIVGRRHVLVRPAATLRFRNGFRSGGGAVAAVVRPGTLVEQWRILLACVRADAIVVVQAANTGLTGGSTPDGDDYDRPVVLVSTMRLNRLHLVDGGRQAICLPGVSLSALERVLKLSGRVPHSVLGSSCFGATVVGGVCNGSGGALVARGPAYTELALFARVDSSGHVDLCNHLGVALGDRPETILDRLERGAFDEKGVASTDGRVGFDCDYARAVRDVESPSPARHNADPRRLREAAGCAGRLMVFAVRVDTFEAPRRTRTFIIGAGAPDVLEKLRRSMLSGEVPLPLEAEYLHGDAFDVADRYGKDMFMVVRWLGPSWLPRLAKLLARAEQGICAIGLSRPHAIERAALALARMLPDHLPARLRELRARYDHLLLLRCADDGIEATREAIKATVIAQCGAAIEATDAEARAAFLHRFVVAAAGIKARAVDHRSIGEVLSLDVALRRNDRDWFEVLPDEISEFFAHRLYYGHFFCHVFHQDYLLKPGVDPVRAKAALLADLDRRGARYPAEHNVGHEYCASPELEAHFRSLDPGNRLNPGIGRTTKLKDWKTAEAVD